ncbi:ATP synthase F1 subunit delta [Rickettsia endosymbiont of Halotydeus destructor]|uniref:ATP synthase F1 subunit delta n=1 Tax=Rickettsia endosymbiont of Halotydeus destructor TaxID=2996754 RepID=UPI003BAE7E9A
MTQKNLSKNYAFALFNNGKDNNSEEEIYEQIKVINQAINDNIDIKKVMSSPIIHKLHKIKAIQLLAKTFKINNIVQNFLLLLIKNSRMSILEEIVKIYHQLLDESKNIKAVEVISAKILKSQEQDWAQKYIEEILKQKIDIHFTLEPSIIGGLVIKYDSILQDYSIKGSLEKIAKTLKTTRYEINK